MMVGMDLDQRLVDAAYDLMTRRWPGTGWAVAAAMYLDDGQVLTSVALDNLNSAVNLCAETGAMCQAYTMAGRVTASVCVSRENGILAPCGICQERLALWGPDIQVAVPDDGAAEWQARTLRELNPFYWGTTFAAGDGWPSPADHRS